MEEIEITVVNWKKYNPESERIKTPHWFRINKDTAVSDSLEGLTAEQCWVWIQLLSECCRKNCDTIMVKVDKLARLSNVKKSCIVQTIEILTKNKTLRSSAESTPPTEHNRTNITEHNITKTFSSELAFASPRVTALFNPDDFFINLSEETKIRVSSVYPDQEFVNREVNKMKIWLSANSKKIPRSKSGWTRFIMGWLERGWERHRKTIASNPIQEERNRILTKEEMEWNTKRSQEK